MLYPIVSPPTYKTVKDSIYFKTVILNTLDGTDGRKQLIEVYKFKTTFRITAIFMEEVQFLRNALHSQKNEVVIPIWSQAIISETNTYNTTTFDLGQPTPYFVGEQIIVTDKIIGGSHLDYFEVVSVSNLGQIVTLDHSTSLIEGALFAPYRVGKLTASVSSENRLGIIEEFEITFEEY